jgi:hypothetical protein
MKTYTVSMLASLALSAWMIYFFWYSGHIEPWLRIFTPDRWGANMTWVALLYLFIQIPMSAQTMFTRHRWTLALLDIGSSFVPIAILIVAFSQWSITMPIWAKQEIALQLLVLTIGEAALSIGIGFVVNTRFGLLQGSTN